ncbi:hypothetical protein [Streptomyces sp. NPDC053048]|uniref:hypothetical protein n=1 Tax=Streptomyces sp. NPDC053048 TaxID=3365694 RepID=UPI0037D0E3D7
MAIGISKRRALCLAVSAALALVSAAATAPSAQADSVSYRIKLTTGPHGGCGTDNTVMGQLIDASGHESAWVKFDKSWYDDFETNDVDTYTINVPRGFNAKKIQLWKGGNDDWCFRGGFSNFSVTRPNGREDGVNTPTARVYWLTEEEERREPTPANTTYDYYYHHYSPAWTLY